MKDNTSEFTSPLTDKQTEMLWKLRSEYPVGIMDCKRALIETKWNYEKAKKIVLNVGGIRI